MNSERTLDKIAAAFAEAAASGDFEKAEGWLAVASFAQDRTLDAGRPAR